MDFELHSTGPVLNAQVTLLLQFWVVWIYKHLDVLSQFFHLWHFFVHVVVLIVTAKASVKPTCRHLKALCDPSIHFLYPLNPTQVLSQLSLGKRQGRPWTGRQSITGPHRDKRDTQPCTLTPRDNLESPINLTCMFSTWKMIQYNRLVYSFFWKKVQFVFTNYCTLHYLLFKKNVLMKFRYFFCLFLLFLFIFSPPLD